MVNAWFFFPCSKRQIIACYAMVILLIKFSLRIVERGENRKCFWHWVFLECSQMIPDVSPSPHVSHSKKKISIYTYHIFHNISHSLVPSKCWCHVARDYIMYMTAWFFPLLISNMQTLQQALDVKHHKTGRLCRFWPV